MRILILLLMAVSCFGAVQGDPLPSQPGPLPMGWVEIGNDNFVPEQPDDNLTASWQTGFRIGDYVIGTEYGMETCNSTKTRVDVVTVDVGQSWLADAHNDLVVSIGFRYYGNIGGQTAQNDFHKAIQNNEWDAQYPSDASETPLLIASYRYHAPIGKDSSWYGSACVCQTMQQLDADVSVGLYRQTPHDCGWLGIGYGHTIGVYYGPTDADVQRHFDEFSIRAGASIHGMEYNALIGTHGGYANLGVSW